MESKLKTLKHAQICVIYGQTLYNRVDVYKYQRKAEDWIKEVSQKKYKRLKKEESS